MENTKHSITRKYLLVSKNLDLFIFKCVILNKKPKFGQFYIRKRA